AGPGAAAGTAPPTRRRPGLARPVAGLAARADAMVFGPGQPTPEQVEEYWEQVDATVRALQAAVPARVRVRGRWSTASLRARRRDRRGERRAGRRGERR
ncbi:MAG: transglutaminase domain-containing protein, partial [Actinotalea sp.]|nr:transglutaminase domain-containing protein [Actinotalea sp.]